MILSTKGKAPWPQGSEELENMGSEILAIQLDIKVHILRLGRMLAVLFFRYSPFRRLGISVISHCRGIQEYIDVRFEHTRHLTALSVLRESSNSRAFPPCSSSSMTVHACHRFILFIVGCYPLPPFCLSGIFNPHAFTTTTYWAIRDFCFCAENSP